MVPVWARTYIGAQMNRQFREEYYEKQRNADAVLASSFVASSVANECIVES